MYKGKGKSLLMEFHNASILCASVSQNFQDSEWLKTTPSKQTHIFGKFIKIQLTILPLKCTRILKHHTRYIIVYCIWFYKVPLVLNANWHFAGSYSHNYPPNQYVLMSKTPVFDASTIFTRNDFEMNPILGVYYNIWRF